MRAALSASCLFVGTFAQIIDEDSLARRSLDRFRVGHSQNSLCWDRRAEDGFLNVIDLHNHFEAFGGPGVPFQTYLSWMRENGILFANMMGLGQRLVQHNPSDPACCYYLHCPTFNYTVEPSIENDVKNAINYRDHYINSNLNNTVYLLPSLTFANLQSPQNNSEELDYLLTEFPNTFKWIGEINVFKHALAANGFFNNPPVTEASVNNGSLDSLLGWAQRTGTPVTLHCDIGCDNYDSVPNAPEACATPPADEALAAQNFQWWKTLLGDYYPAFFNESNYPLPNFRKIQHVKVFDTILSRYPNMTVVWAHLGLSKELLDLHPLVHIRIMETMFERHPLCNSDISWDIISTVFLLDFNNETVDGFLPEVHDDLPNATKFDVAALVAKRQDMYKAWLSYLASPANVPATSKLGGPTYNFALTLDTFVKYSDRFVTGTDFVASFGSATEYPGLAEYVSPAKGCTKTLGIHASQATDTSAVNIFFPDEAFERIVLGKNFFRIAKMSSQYAPPAVCATVYSGASDLSMNHLVIAATLAWLAVAM